nr:peptidyl-prolyl cis-trans isomerase FKBP16-4, chloroplastic isoform X1 [Tanacetum cinerariifolium]
MAAEARFTDLQLWKFLSSNPSTLGEAFFKARITEARFEVIAKKEKGQSVEKKMYIILPLQSEFTSPKIKGSLNADEYISVEEVLSGGEALGIGEDDDLCNAATDEGNDAVESGDISILNSLIGHGSPHSLQLCGTIGTTDVQALIDKEPYGLNAGESEAGNVLKGLDIGVQGLRIGGQRVLIVPPEHAYGSMGVQQPLR